MNFNEEDLKKELDFYNHKTFWFCVFQASYQDEKQGVMCEEFCNKEKVIQLAKEYNGLGLVCVAVNERAPYERTKNEVKKVNALFIDIDVKKGRKKGYVSTKTDKDHILKIINNLIIYFLNGKGFVVDILKDSGNGFQILMKTDINVSTDSLREIFIQKAIALENELKQFEDDILEIDIVTKDLNRRIKLAGTINKKDVMQDEDRIAKIIRYEYRGVYSSDLNTKALELLETKKEIKEKTEEEDITDYQEKLKRIRAKDSKLDVLLKGKLFGFNSRSELEASIIEKLLFYRFTKDHIYKIMKVNCSKWNEKPIAYKELTFDKCLQDLKIKIEKIKAHIENEE